MPTAREEFEGRYVTYFGTFPAENDFQASIWWRFVDRIPAFRLPELFEAVQKARRNAWAKPRLGAFQAEWAHLTRSSGGDSPGVQWEMSLTPVEKWMARCRYNSLTRIQKFMPGGCSIVADYCRRAGVEASHENAAYVCLALEMHESIGACPALKEGEPIAAPIEETWYWRCKEAGVWGAAGEEAEATGDETLPAAPLTVADVLDETEAPDEDQIPF